MGWFMKELWGQTYEWILEEANAEQKRLRAEARANQECLREETRLSHTRLMAEIEASRIIMEEHSQANEELWKTNKELQRNLHRQGRRPTWEYSRNLSLRDDPKSFSQQIMEEGVSSHYITLMIAFFLWVRRPRESSKDVQGSNDHLWGQMQSDVGYSWVPSQEQLCNGLVKSWMVTSPLSLSSLECLRSSSRLIRSTLHNCMIFSMSKWGKASYLKNTWIDYVQSH